MPFLTRMTHNLIKIMTTTHDDFLNFQNIKYVVIAYIYSENCEFDFLKHIYNGSCT